MIDWILSGESLERFAERDPSGVLDLLDESHMEGHQIVLSDKG